jgi:hypothetical protein
MLVALRTLFPLCVWTVDTVEPQFVWPPQTALTSSVEPQFVWPPLTACTLYTYLPFSCPPTPGMEGSKWSPAESKALIAGVRAYLLQGPKHIPWEWVWERVKDHVPGRTKAAVQVHVNRRRREGDYGGAGPTAWTREEDAVLDAAVAASERIVGLHAIDWAFVHSCSGPALAGRKTSAISNQWRSAICHTPAAKAMLAEVTERVARKGAGAGAGAAVAQQQPKQLQPVTPFHLLHSLFESGCMDEATLSACWKAAAAAAHG